MNRPLRVFAAHVHAPVVSRTAGRNPHVVLHICEKPGNSPKLDRPETPTLSPCECKHGAALVCIGATANSRSRSLRGPTHRNADSCTYPATGRRAQTAHFALCAQLIRLICPSELLTSDTHDRGILIAERYGFSVYDALIVASARLSGGETLVLRAHAGWARGRRTGANLIHSKRSRRQRLEPATPSPASRQGFHCYLMDRTTNERNASFSTNDPE